MNKTAEEKAKERCSYELFVEKYFGLPGDIKTGTKMKGIEYDDLVGLLAAFDQDRASLIKKIEKRLLSMRMIPQADQITRALIDENQRWLKFFKNEKPTGNPS
jgi:hypothetical protein